MLEIGAFPFMIKKGKIQIMLVKTISGNSWILPKGRPEDNLKQPQVAELESYEEAGIKGKVYSSNSHKEFDRETGGTIVIYPLLIKKTLDQWPEKEQRERRLVSIKEAMSLVSKQEHIDAIKYFSNSDFIKKLIKNN